MAKGKDVVPVKKTNLPSPEALKTKLATAKTTDEVKPIITAAKALKVVAKDAKNRQAIADATEVVRRAERKLGQVMAEQKVTVGFNKGAAENGRNAKNAGFQNPALPPTLAEAGIDKNLAYRARKWAEFDDEDFEYELKDELDEILNPPPTWEQREDERKAQKAYERTPEGQAELRRRERSKNARGRRTGKSTRNYTSTSGCRRSRPMNPTVRRSWTRRQCAPKLFGLSAARSRPRPKP
jgi:hypothetical protein